MELSRMKAMRKVTLLLLCLLMTGALTACGGGHGSPKGIVKSLVKYSVAGKESKIEDCYSQVDDLTKQEIASTTQYYEAMKADGMEVTSCDIIQDYGDYSYVYITFGVKLSKDKSYPRVETYFVKKDNKKYYILPSSQITTQMNQQAISAYEEFQNSDAYKQYQKDYETFLLKSPNFESELALKLNGGE